MGAKLVRATWNEACATMLRVGHQERAGALTADGGVRCGADNAARYGIGAVSWLAAVVSALATITVELARLARTGTRRIDAPTDVWIENLFARTIRNARPLAVRFSERATAGAWDSEAEARATLGPVGAERFQRGAVGGAKAGGRLARFSFGTRRMTAIVA